MLYSMLPDYICYTNHFIIYSMGYRPLGNKLLLEIYAKKETTSGIILPDKDSRESRIGVIKKIGLLVSNEQKEVLKEGLKVMFMKHVGIEVGKNLVLVSEDQLYGVEEDETN